MVCTVIADQEASVGYVAALTHLDDGAYHTTITNEASPPGLGSLLTLVGSDEPPSSAFYTTLGPVFERVLGDDTVCPPPPGGA